MPSSSPRLSKRLVAEALGTYVLVFVGTGAVVVNQVSEGAVGLVGIAMAFGLVVMAMVYAFGDLSGAHINPAVTVALAAIKKFPLAEVGPYLAAQSIGAIAASGTLRVLYPDATTLGATLPAGPWTQSFVLEVLLTAFLVLVILNVTAPGKPEALLAGVAIGGTVAFEVLCGGPISGASMNPARSLGPAVVGGQFGSLWIYLAAPVLGGILGALVTDYLRCAGHASEDAPGA